MAILVQIKIQAAQINERQVLSFNINFKLFLNIYVLFFTLEMPRDYKRRLDARPYRNYTQRYLDEAVNSVKSKQLSLREASHRSVP